MGTDQRGVVRLTRKEIRRHFTNYLLIKWKWLNLPKPTDIQNEIAEWYQHGPDRKQIQGFRGVAKSWIVCSYCEWMWDQDPDYRIIVLSGNGPKANEISVFIKRCIEEFPYLSHLCPPNLNKAIWGNERFFVHGANIQMAPSLKSVGITGNFTGSRANEIIADDIEIPSNSMTADMRDKLFKRSTEMESVIVPEGGKITLLGTPQTEETIYKRYEEKGYTVRRWPARVPDRDKLAAYGSTLSPLIRQMVDQELYGNPTEPTRFTDYVLAQKEVCMGSSEFALQFMLDTSLADADRYPLKLKDLVVTSLDNTKAPISMAWAATPDTQVKELTNIGFTGDRFHRPVFVDKEWAPYESTIMTVDPSGRGPDEVGYCVMSQLMGRLILRDFGGLKGGFEEQTLEQLALKAKEHSVNLVLLESNFGDGMFLKLLQPIMQRYHKCRLEEERVTGQKERRIISALEPVLNQHRLVVDYGAVARDIKRVTDSSKEGDCWYSGLYQLTRITKEKGACKHDDVLDAISAAVRYFTDAMARDTEESKEQYLMNQRDEEIQEWLRGAMSFPSGKPAMDLQRLRQHGRALGLRSLRFNDPLAKR